MVSLGCNRKCGQQVEGADPAPLFSPREATSGVERYGQSSLYGLSKKRSHSRGVAPVPLPPAEATMMDLRSGASLMRRCCRNWTSLVQRRKD